MQLANLGWVNDPDDLLSWENGLRWLSKAIVSDNDPADKLELKGQLLLHLEAAAAHPRREVRAAAVFFCLAWRRFELLDRFWQSARPREMPALLRQALLKIYAKVNLAWFDPAMMVCDGRTPTLQRLRLFFEEKKIEAELVGRLVSGLRADDDGVVAETVNRLAELCLRLDIPFAFFQDAVEQYLRRMLDACDEALRARDDGFCLHFLDLIEPIRPLLLVRGFSPEGLLRRLVFHCRRDALRDVLAYLLRWRSRQVLAAFCGAQRDGSHLPVLAEALVRACRLEQAAAAGIGELLLFCKGKGWDAVNELLQLAVDPDAEAPLLVGFFRAALEAPPVAGPPDPLLLLDRLLTVFSVRCAAVRGVRDRFLAEYWETTVASVDPVLWVARLRRLAGLLRSGADPLLESEFFLPLVREGVASHASLVTREILRFVAEDPAWLALVREWLSNAFVGEDLAEGLFSNDLHIQVRTLNRLVSIFFRVRIVSPHLIRVLDRFRQGLERQPILPDLRIRMLKATDGLLARLV